MYLGPWFSPEITTTVGGGLTLVGFSKSSESSQGSDATANSLEAAAVSLTPGYASITATLGKQSVLAVLGEEDVEAQT